MFEEEDMQQVLDATGVLVTNMVECSKRWTKQHMTSDVCAFMQILAKVIPGMTEIIDENKGDDESGLFESSE